MPFTTEDLKTFLTTYRGIADPHDAVRAAWEDLTVDHSAWLDVAPTDVRDTVAAYLGDRLVLSAPVPVLRAPFGDIRVVSTDDIDTQNSWFLDTRILLGVGDRLFSTSNYTEDGKVCFDGSSLQEVREVKSVQSRFIEDHEIGPFKVSDASEFVPKVKDKDDPDHIIQAKNLVYALSHPQPVEDGEEPSKSPVNDAYCVLHRVGEFIVDPEGHRITNYGERTNLDQARERKIVVNYRRGMYILNFPWDSYGGVMTEEVSVSPTFMASEVRVTELTPVDYSVELVEADMSYLDDSTENGNPDPDPLDVKPYFQ